MVSTTADSLGAADTATAVTTGGAGAAVTAAAGTTELQLVLVSLQVS